MLMTVGGGTAFERYFFYPSCSHGQGIVVQSDDSPTLWEYDEEASILDELCGGPIGAKLVKSGVGEFDWEVFVLDADDNTLARFELVHAWRPNCSNKFKLVERDETCDVNVRWQPYMCVAPYFTTCSSLVPSVVFTSTFAGFNADDFPLILGGCTFPRPLLPTPSFLFQAGSDPCTWPSPDTDSITFTCEGIEFTVTANAAVVFEPTTLQLAMGFGVTITWSGGSNSSVGGFVGPNGVLGGTIPLTDPSGTYRGDLIGFAANINGQSCPQTCTGDSRWILRREECEDSDLYMYFWELFDSDCDGQCYREACRPSIPEEPFIPPEPLEDSEADLLGLLSLLPADPEDVQEEELVNGNCLCQEEYEPTTCCTGSSTWMLAKQFCYTDGEDYFIYYWDFVSSDCGGPCVDDLETCREQPPATPVLPTDPVVADLELDSLVGVEDNTGVCNCLEAYVPPECPECDCDDVNFDRTFTISGLTGDHEIYNGTHTIEKGGSGCDLEPCCWGGVVGNPDVNATLFWDAGLWTLTVTSAFADGAVYEVVGEACDDPIVLSKISGSASMPATITVS